LTELLASSKRGKSKSRWPASRTARQRLDGVIEEEGEEGGEKKRLGLMIIRAFEGGRSSMSDPCVDISCLVNAGTRNALALSMLENNFNLEVYLGSSWVGTEEV
jgi:hypothetical protein